MSKKGKEDAMEMFSRTGSDYSNDQAPSPPPVRFATAYREHEYKPLSWFKTNPINRFFQEVKTDQYWKDLEADIRNTGFIRDALLAMPDGTLLSGESRVTVCRKLAEEGISGLDPLPVRITINMLSEQEQTETIFLENLSRFELDEDTRVLAYKKIWPGYFSATKLKPGPKAENQQPEPTVQDIAAATGKSERQLQRDRKLLMEAEAEASKEGKQEPERKHVESARQKKAAERREKSKAQKPKPTVAKQQASKTFPVNFGLTLAESEKLLAIMSNNPDAATRKLIERLRNARRSAARKAS
jgi:hypothetical protein